MDSPNLKIRCVHCDKLVDRWETHLTDYDNSVVITVWCHGARDFAIIPRSIIDEDATAGDGLWRDIWTGAVEGEAFQTRVEPT